MDLVLFVVFGVILVVFALQLIEDDDNDSEGNGS